MKKILFLLLLGTVLLVPNDSFAECGYASTTVGSTGGVPIYLSVNHCRGGRPSGDLTLGAGLGITAQIVDVKLYLNAVDWAPIQGPWGATTNYYGYLQSPKGASIYYNGVYSVVRIWSGEYSGGANGYSASVKNTATSGPYSINAGAMSLHFSY